VLLLGGSIAFEERTMESKSVFISSCSRRQFARRRPTRRVVWFHTHLWTMVLVVAVASVVAIRAGF
jgi:anti-sigma-K factor RskA